MTFLRGHPVYKGCAIFPLFLLGGAPHTMTNGTASRDLHHPYNKEDNVDIADGSSHKHQLYIQIGVAGAVLLCAIVVGVVITIGIRKLCKYIVNQLPNRVDSYYLNQRSYKNKMNNSVVLIITGEDKYTFTSL